MCVCGPSCLGMEVSVGLRVVEVIRWFNREYIRAFNIASG